MSNKGAAVESLYAFCENNPKEIWDSKGEHKGFRKLNIDKEVEVLGMNWKQMIQKISDYKASQSYYDLNPNYSPRKMVSTKWTISVKDLG